jgi:hypothetical protein
VSRRALSLATCLVGAVLLACAAWFEPRAVLAAWLAALLGFAAVPLGCLALALLLALVSGAWRDLLLPGALLGTRAVPWIALLVVPLLLGVRLLYPWAQDAAPGLRGVWLNPTAFVIRALLYVALWVALARGLLPRLAGAPGLAGPGLVLLVLSLSAAAIDWAMSLDAEFFSTLFGLLYLARALLSGIAFAVLVALANGASRLGVLRGLLVAALLLWLYLHFMQLLIVWSADVPREARWYLWRSQGVWLGVLWLLGAGQGALGLLGLSVWPERRPAGLVAVAALTLPLGLFEALWLVLPAFRDENPLWLWLFGGLAWMTAGGLFGLAWLPREAVDD